MDSGHAIQTFSVNSGLGLTFRCLALAGLGLTSGCSGLVLDLRHDPDPAAGLTLPLEVSWIYNARAGFGPEAPLVRRHHVVVATRQGEVHVVDLGDGKRVGTRRFGDAVNGMPALVGERLIVPLAWGRRALVGYDFRSASVVWRLAGAPVSVGPLVVGTDVIAVASDAVVRRLRVTDGSAAWIHELPAHLTVHARPVAGGGHILIADDEGGLHALNPDTGEARWYTRLDAPVYSEPAVKDDQVYVATTRGLLYAIDALSGATNWVAEVDNAAVRLSAPATDGGLVVVGGTDGALYAWSALDGSRQWVFQAPDALVAKPLIAGSVVYVGSMGNHLYAVDLADGRELQAIELRGRIKSEIVQHADGLIVLAEPRYVVNLRPVADAI